MLRLLVKTQNPTVAQFLNAQLPVGFEVHVASSGRAFVEQALRERPKIVIIEMDGQADRAEMEIAVVKHACPDARIIVLSPTPSRDDGAIVERGIFYYLTRTWGGELVQVIHAAARSLVESSERFPASETIRGDLS